MCTNPSSFFNIFSAEQILAEIQNKRKKCIEALQTATDTEGEDQIKRLESALDNFDLMQPKIDGENIIIVSIHKSLYIICVLSSLRIVHVPFMNYSYI